MADPDLRPMGGGACVGAYPPIDSYAFLADGQSATLIGPDGAVEWLCAPRFDGASVFARLLDRDRGGAFELTVDGAAPAERRYVDGTLVLESRFESDGTSVVAFDFMALEAEGRHGPGEVDPFCALVRLVRCEHGEARVSARIDARPDYGRQVAAWVQQDGFFTAEVPCSRLWASSNRQLSLTPDGLEAPFVLREGEAAAFALRYAGDPVAPISAARAEELLEVTVSSWSAWSSRCEYEGVARELVLRSAVVLKGLVYHASGALLAAATTSLPEQLGGERNWDYRYTWLRDAALTLLALMQLGYEHEARDYMDFLLRECADCGEELHLMLGIDGERDLVERSLDHLEGYACSRPVRIGNGAHEQFQLGTYGAMLGAALIYQQRTGALTTDHWALLGSLVEFTAAHWREPDNGIWEVRSERRHFTHSKVMAWVCVDRGIQLAELIGIADAPLERWREARDAIRADVLEHGYDERRGAFVQSYGDGALDASALRFPLVEFIAGDDPRMVSTIDRVIAELESSEGLVHRYDQDQSDDGLTGDEGAFAICSFWLVSALARAGRQQEAERRFAALCERASDLGLYAEELAPQGMLGNFPQAFTHLALIQAAADLEAGRDSNHPHPATDTSSMPR
jgi:GH15 family glucan-1,4-alpha-glucosidase